MADGEACMIMAVQRPRGPMGWDPEYAHLGWPSDTTAAQRDRWRKQYDAGQYDGRSMSPKRNPTRPPALDVRRLGPTCKTRYRVGWRGRLVLQVFEPNPLPWPYGFHYPGGGWRDATLNDLRRIAGDGGDLVVMGGTMVRVVRDDRLR